MVVYTAVFVETTDVDCNDGDNFVAGWLTLHVSHIRSV